MTERDAVAAVNKKFKGYKVNKVRETPLVYVFLCENPDKEIIPSKLAAAVSKKTGKIGMSITGYDEAIRQAIK